MHNSRFSPLQMLMFVLAFGLIGAYILIRSFAAPLTPNSVQKAPGPDTKARALMASQQLVAGAPLLKHASEKHDTAKHDKVKGELAKISEQRNKDLTELMETDPKSARQAILPDDTIAKLSSEGVSTEQRVTISGKYNDLQIDDPKAGDLIYSQVKSSDGNTYTLDTEQNIPRIRFGSTVQVSGYVLSDPSQNRNGADLSNQFLVDASPTVNTYYSKDSTVAAPVTVIQTAPAANPNTTGFSTGNINTAIIALNTSDSSVDMSKVKTLINGNPGHDVVSYFGENSFGKATYVPSYFGPYTISKTCLNTTGDDIVNTANTYITFSNYKRIIYILNCGGRSVGCLSPNYTTPQGTVTACTALIQLPYTEFAYVHELAHDSFDDTSGLSNGHGAFYDCYPQAFVAPTAFGSDNDCISYDYGDLFDALGAGSNNAFFYGTGYDFPQMSPYHKQNAGWLTPGTTQYPLVTSSGSYTLSPYETGNGTTALDIPRGDGSVFTVEYRQPVGFDYWMNGSSGECKGASCNVTQGASIRLVYDTFSDVGGRNDDQLIDNTPGSNGLHSRDSGLDTLDGALLPGKTFTDSLTGIQITAVSASASGLSVNVSIPTSVSCTRVQPSVSAPSPSTQTAAPGVTKTYTFILTNNDSANCKPNQFKIRPGRLGSGNGYEGTSISTPDFVTLASGASATVSVAITPSTLVTDNTYSVSTPQASPSLASIFANTFGMSSVNVAGVTYTVSTPADTTAPTAPTNFKASALGSRAVKLTWTASTDIGGVAGYNVYDSVNGVGCPTVPVGTSSCVVPNLYPNTTYNFSISAFDHKQNQSATAAASVTTPSANPAIYPTAPDASFSATDHSVTTSWAPGYTKSPLGIAYYNAYTSVLNNYFKYLPGDNLSSTYYGWPSQTKIHYDMFNCDGDGNCGEWTNSYIYAYTAVEGSSSPSQPKGLYISSATSAGTTLKWNPSTDARGIAYYKIYRDDRYIGQSNTNSYTDTTAPGGDRYGVQAVNIDGSLSQLNKLGGDFDSMRNPPVSSASPETPPISTLTSSASGSTLTGTVTLSVSVANATSCTSVTYYIDGISIGSSSAAPYSVNVDTTNARVGGNGPHSVVAEAYNSCNPTATNPYPTSMGSTGSIDVTFNNSGADLTPPTINITSPTNGSTVSGTVNVAANASDNKAVDHVELSVDGNTLSSLSTAPYTFSWNSSSVPNGSHTITATAYDAAGNSAVSTITVTTANADTSAPTAPSNLTATAASTTSINLSWSASTDNLGVAGYYIIRAGVTVAQTDSTVCSGSTCTYSDSNLSPATSYSYQVEAYDGANNISNPSNTANVTTQSPAPDTEAPTAPTNLVAGVVSSYQANLSWKASTDNVAVDHYDLYRSNTKINSVDAASATDSSGNVSFADLTAHAGTSYSYWLYAYDKASNKSAISNKVSVVTPKLVLGYASLTGRLSNPSGSPVSSAKIAYSYNGRTISSSSNTNGNYVLSSIPANLPLNFSYSLTGYLTQSLPLTLTPDQNTVQDMTLHKLGTITGKVTDSASGQALRATITYQLNGATKSLRPASNGTYTITGLPAGSYSLTYTLSGYTPQTQSLNVNNDQTTTQNVSLTHL